MKCISDGTMDCGLGHGAANLVTITVDGKRTDAVAVTKRGDTFVFDRVTGKPCGRRRASGGNEQRRAREGYPTQPFPTSAGVCAAGDAR